MISKEFVKWFVPLVIAFLLCGCGKDVSEIASSVKQAASEGLDQARQTASDVSESVAEKARGATGAVSEGLGLAGDFQLNAGQPMAISGCYVTLVTPVEGGPAILQLQSYQEASQESFPSVLVRAEVTAASISELTGQTVQAQVFLKPRQDQPTLFAFDSNVQVKINGIEDEKVVGEIVAGTLSGVDEGQPPVPVSGDFRGVIR